MNLKRIHHVAYRCKDAKETVEFYQRVLNMEFQIAIAEDRVPSTREPDPYMHVFLDAGMGNVLAFFELPTRKPMDRDHNTPEWVQHIAFEVEDYDALLISGGRAPEYIRQNDRVLEIVKEFAKADKPIAAVCHGAQVLTAAGVVEGKSVSAYPAVGPEVAMAGGRYAAIGMNEAHVDGKLVTAPAWPAHPAWLGKFLEVLGTKIEL